MILEQWLKNHNLSVPQAAEKMGYTKQRLYQVIKGNRPAGANLIRAINKLTGGDVSCDDLLYPKEEGEKTNA